MDIKEITKTAGITALFACGHQGPTSTAPPAVVAYARAFAAAVAGLAGASMDATNEKIQWHTAPEDQIGSALYALARDGLIPGGQSDPSATGYLFRQKGGGPTGRPSPRGRLAMARAAGANVRAIVVGRSDKLELTEDGDVAHLDLHPDDRPVAWGDIRGVAVRVDDLRTGERITAWVSAAEIGSRKDKGSDRGGGWATDAVGMAATKAISIAVSRGIVPQASLIPSIVGAHGPVAPRALTIEAAAAPRQIAEPTPAAPPPAEPEPTPEPNPQPEAPAEPEQPEAPAPRPIGVADIRDRIEAAVGGSASKFSWDDVGEAMASTLRRAAAGTTKKGGTWSDDDISPAAAEWVVTEAVKTLRSM